MSLQGGSCQSAEKANGLGTDGPDPNPGIPQLCEGLDLAGTCV